MKSIRALLGICEHRWEQTGVIEANRDYYRPSAPETIIRTRMVGMRVTLKCRICGTVKSKTLA